MRVPERIAITGSSGLIGTSLVGHLKSEGHTVQRLVRRAPVAVDEVTWDPNTGYVDLSALEGVDAIIHLAAAFAIVVVPINRELRISALYFLVQR